jgi:hypothetical protein
LKGRSAEQKILQMPEHYTRESLLAAWESMTPSNPLSKELQVLCLLYFNCNRVSGEGWDTAHRPAATQNSQMPPPRRFVRRGRPTHSTAPCGPAIQLMADEKLETSHSAKLLSKGQVLDSVPAGPSAGIDDVCPGPSAAELNLCQGVLFES